jgi:hypothetical protein
LGLPFAEVFLAEGFVFAGAFVGKDDAFSGKAVFEGGCGGTEFAFRGDGATGFAAVFAGGLGAGAARIVSGWLG